MRIFRALSSWAKCLKWVELVIDFDLCAEYPAERRKLYKIWKESLILSAYSYKWVQFIYKKIAFTIIILFIFDLENNIKKQKTLWI